MLSWNYSKTHTHLLHRVINARTAFTVECLIPHTSLHIVAIFGYSVSIHRQVDPVHDETCYPESVSEQIAPSNKLRNVGVFILIIMNYGDDYETENKTLNQIVKRCCEILCTLFCSPSVACARTLCYSWYILGVPIQSLRFHTQNRNPAVHMIFGDNKTRPDKTDVGSAMSLWDEHCHLLKTMRLQFVICLAWDGKMRERGGEIECESSICWNIMQIKCPFRYCLCPKMKSQMWISKVYVPAITLNFNQINQFCLALDLLVQSGMLGCYATQHGGASSGLNFTHIWMIAFIHRRVRWNAQGDAHTQTHTKFAFYTIPMKNNLCSSSQ